MNESNIDSFITKYPNVIRFLSYFYKRKIPVGKSTECFKSLTHMLNSLHQIITYYSVDQGKIVCFVLVYRNKQNYFSVMDVKFEKYLDGFPSKIQDYSFVFDETENFIKGYLEGLSALSEYTKAITEKDYKLLFEFPIIDDNATIEENIKTNFTDSKIPETKNTGAELKDSTRVEVMLMNNVYYCNPEKKIIYYNKTSENIFYDGELNDQFLPDGIGKMYWDVDDTWFDGIFSKGKAINGILYHKKGPIEFIQGIPNLSFEFSKARIKYRDGKIFDGSLHPDTELPNSGSMIYPNGDRALITVNSDSTIEEMAYINHSNIRGYTLNITKGTQCEFANYAGAKHNFKLKSSKKFEEDPNKLDVTSFHYDESLFCGLLAIVNGDIEYIKGSLTGSATYKGEFEHNLPCGIGVLDLFYGSKIKASFCGGDIMKLSNHN